MSNLDNPCEQPGLKELLESERELLAKRRKEVGLDTVTPTASVVGIALSGGGIRSATFCLGLFQGLAKRSLISRIDYLSTVSGGGYFGSFFGRMFTRKWALASDSSLAPQYKEQSTEKSTLRIERRPVAMQFMEEIKSTGVIKTIETILKDGTLPPLRWLREGGNYLTPGGSGDAALAAAVFVRNWIAVLIVSLVSLLTLFLGGNFLRAELNSWACFHKYELWLQAFTTRHLWWTPWWFVPWLVLIMIVVPVGWAFWLTQASQKQQFAYVSIANLVTIGFGILAFTLLPNSIFRLGAIGLGFEALLALAWIWILGASYCMKGKNRVLLPRKQMVLSTLLICSSPLVWRLLLLRHNKPLTLEWVVLIVLSFGVFHHLALRSADPKSAKVNLQDWFGSWKVDHWKTQWPGMVCWAGMVILVPLIANCLGRSYCEQAMVSGLLDVWICLTLFAGPYFLAYQVLSKDRAISILTTSDKPTLTPWLRNKLSIYLNVGLVVFGCLLALVAINSIGQSLYAVASYKGGLMSVLALVGSALGLAGIAPLARTIAIRSMKARGRLGVSIQLLALLGALVLAFCLLVIVSYISHGIAWRWGCPVITPFTGQESVENRLQYEWSTNSSTSLSLTTTNSTVTNAASTFLTNSPGANIARRWFNEEEVKLTKENLIEVEKSKADDHHEKPQDRMFILDLGLSFGVGLALTWLFGNIITFLNLSSFHSIYTARLIRAYQGATNPKRWGLSDLSIDDIDGGDDIPWHEYKPFETGGPLHLVNMAVNCTVTRDTNKESTTAKGINLCVGPSGLSFGHQHALGWLTPEGSDNNLPGSLVQFAEIQMDKAAIDPKVRFLPKRVEPLTLGGWVGISGAAFTTGLGNVGGRAGTAIGTSFLCGLFNIRLGYWWENEFSPPGSLAYLLPMQQYLLDELMGSFHLEKRDRWYLSDGGHFENTAAYELIRRQTSFIIISDAGADPDGQFDDLANLVRRARVDFGVEIEFATDAELQSKVDKRFLAPCVNWRIAGRDGNGKDQKEPPAIAGCIGVLADLRPHKPSEAAPGRVRAHATLAKIHYDPNHKPNGKKGTLLIIKPGITDDLPEDLINYQQNEPEFPQQSTLEQFFDEAQWESYRKLAEFVSMRIFDVADKPESGKWFPNQMRNIDWDSVVA